MDRQSDVEQAARPSGSDRDERRRVEELLRVNARLAAEVRSLVHGRTEAPRPGSMTASRRLGALIDERDTLRERLEQAEQQLGQIATLNQQCAALERDRDALAAEVRRLRGGWRGIGRRLRARLALRPTDASSNK